MLKESLLHTIWKSHRLYLQPEPILSDGSKIVIHAAGTHNEHRGGPDFLAAEIIIDGLLIKGDIEIHRSIGDWDKHGHTSDPRYSSVILHVVMEDDDVHTPNIPTLALRDNLLFEETKFWTTLFEQHYARSPELPCFPHNLRVRMKSKRSLLQSSAELRLSELVARYNANEREQLTDLVYEHIFDAIGFSQNRTPMKELSRLLPRRLLQQIRASESVAELPAILEALFFGVSGLLVSASEKYTTEVNEYLLDLSAKWEALQISYSIPEVLSKGDWAFFRIRPVNSPYRRVALAASLAVRYFSNSEYSVEDEINFHDDTNWWLNRTSYTSELKQPHSLLGEERSKAIEINVLLPARIAALALTSGDTYSSQSQTALRKEWMKLPSHSSAAYCQTIEQELLEGEPIKTTSEEQGALYLHRNYCTRLRCNECPIGKEVLV